MPFYHIEIYNARPQNDGGAIDGVKGTTRAGTVKFTFTSTNTTAAAARQQIFEALDESAHFAPFNNLDFLTAVAAAQSSAEVTAGAYSLRIGKHLYGYKFGSGASAAIAESGVVTKNLS